jgi:glycine betaine/proline transport system ATP-binding protein
MDGGRIVQCGTPGEIYRAPANAHVAEFVAHLNPLGVLCARDVMEPATSMPEETVPPDTDIRAVMARVGATGAPVGVLEDGRIIGQVTKDTVLARLLNPGGRD